MRLTSRGWWFLFLTLVMFGIALIGPPSLYTFTGLAHGRAYWDWSRVPAVGVVVLLALSLFLWFCWEWFVFAARSRFVVGNIRVDRMILDAHGPVRNFWTGRNFTVRVRVSLNGQGRLPFVSVEDRLPFTVRYESGEVFDQAELKFDRPILLEYRIHCTGMGRVRFEGVRVQLADLHGFFYFDSFVSAPVEVRVLPIPADDMGQPAVKKRINLLPPPGVHRLLRPGSGSELLDLRDYIPGDPPKTIAWKVSAKRNKLMTKEYESEVPVRCTLFVDTSDSVRLGIPGRNALSKLVEIASAVAQANASLRDLTGLCLFDETTTRILRPARTPRHLADMTNQLADAAALQPAVGVVDLEALMKLGYSFVAETYPNLLETSVNRVPFWLPRTWPTWMHRRRSRPIYRWIGRMAVLGLATLIFLLIVLLEWALLGLLYEVLPAFMRPPEEVVGFSFLFSSALLYLPFVRFFVDILPAWLSTRRRRWATWRKKLSAILSVRYGLAPGGLGILMEDNELFSLYLQRFLGEHHVPYSVPYYNEQGRYQFASQAKVRILSSALLQAVSKGHDNELFVLMVDLFDLSEHLEPLLAAVRVAMARHHHVVLIVPWPPGKTLPTAQPPDVGQQLDRLLAHPETVLHGHRPKVLNFLEDVVYQRLNLEYHRIRQAFIRLGVPVVCAEGGKPIGVILDRLERLRNVRTRR